MFNLFKKFRKPKKEYYKTKSELLYKIERIQNCLSSNNLYDVDVALNRFKKRLDNSTLYINIDQSKYIDQCLDSIERHCAKKYTELLLNKCSQMEYASINPENAKQMLENPTVDEDVQYEKLGELNDLVDQIQSLDVQMKKIVKTNPPLWNMYNERKKALMQSYQLKLHNFQMRIKNQSNKMLYDESIKAKLDAKLIEATASQVDYESFESNLQYTNTLGETVNDTNDKFSDYMAENFGSESSNSEYLKALEEYELEENKQVNKTILDDVL